MMGRGVGQGGADVSQLQDCDSIACGGGGRGDKFLGRAGAGGAGQDEGCLVVVFFSYYSCANTCPYLSTNSF